MTPADQIDSLSLAPSTEPASDDCSLLRQFAERNDERSFEQLVKLHGPMVFGVCRRMIGNAHDAEDALQATFLALPHPAK